MKGSTQETNIIYVALPMDGGDPTAAPAIFAPTAVPVGALEAGQDDAQERRRRSSTNLHQSHGSMALVRAGLILLVGFLITSFILFGATRGMEGHHRSHRHNSRVHTGCFRGHRSQGMGVQVDAHFEEGNIEVENNREHKMDGRYAGNESHDGWHASTADDEVAADVVAVERWVEEKEDGLIPGLP